MWESYYDRKVPIGTQVPTLTISTGSRFWENEEVGQLVPLVKVFARSYPHAYRKPHDCPTGTETEGLVPSCYIELVRRPNA